MNKIHVLPPALVAKIAAGEVIERPVFVVKELVENALDANATQITIEISKGGLESIIISDNGEGMSGTDLFLCWQRYTTSKTPVDSDLTKIENLGFRGEALASIATVSDLVIQSRLAKDIGGNKVEISNGRLVNTGSVGMAVGTIVKVGQLFSSLPVRQKFLASPQREWEQITRLVESYALAYPEVKFILKHNKRLILDLPVQVKEERLKRILGEELINNIFPFQLNDTHILVDGFLGKPQISFHSNLPSYLIVNRRVVKNRKLAQTLKDAYRGLLKVESSPFFLLYIKTPYEMVDVNIHPRKEEVRFLNEEEFCERVDQEITKVAKGQNFSFRWSTPKAATDSLAAQLLKSEELPSLARIQDNLPIVQLHNLYLMAQTKEGIVIIDQHAAHERVLYEELTKRYLKLSKKQKVFTFPNPKKLSLPFSQATILEDNLENLAKLGFVLEKLSESTYSIKAVPELFHDRNVLQLFQEVLVDLEQDSGLSSSLDKHTQRMLSFLACRAAIKSGQSLSQEEMRELVRQLSLTKTSYTCPHGRPTHIEISLSDLERMFGRK